MSVESYYNNETELMTGLAGAYGALQDGNCYGNAILHITEGMTDYVYSRFVTGTDRFLDDTSNSVFANPYTPMWDMNLTTNAVITMAPGVDMDEDNKAIIIGEAKFLRALNYFTLVRLYGRVPLITSFITDSSEDMIPYTSPREDVYDFIIQDLLDAESVLPTTAIAAGRATKGAAMALLGKVYLTYAGYTMNTEGTAIVKGDSKYYQLAADKLKDVIDLGVYDLFADVNDVFSNDTENGIEHIFSIQFSGDITNEGSQYQTQFAPKDNITGWSYNTYPVEHNFYMSFEDSDLRKEATFLTEYYDGWDVYNNYLDDYYAGVAETYVTIKKYLRDWTQGSTNRTYTMTGSNMGEANFEYLRYADVLLMYSEALVEARGSITDADLSGINKVRNRAGLASYTASSFTDMDDFRIKMLDERNKELCGEGHGWFDYTRMNYQATGIYYVYTAEAVAEELETTGSTNSVTPAFKFFYVPINPVELAKNPDGGYLQSPGW